MNEVSDEMFCRICYCETNPITNKKDLISPCNCSGSVKHVHHTCLKMWRMKGKAFGDMKKCEQCKGKYNIKGDRSLYSVFTAISTLFALFLAYCLSATLFKSFCIAVTSIVEELAFIVSSENISLYQGVYRDYHLACFFLYIASYHIFTDPKAAIIAGYLTSYAGIALYSSSTAKIIFSGISLYIFQKMYSTTYELVDGLWYYMLNINWEKAQQAL